MQNTVLKYMEGMFLYEDTAQIIDIENLENEKQAIVLDQTIFYPQGGGQPYGQGIIENENGKFVVEEVRLVDFAVKHVGHFESGSFENKETVNLKIDKNRRNLNSRNHSGGHLIDMALDKLDYNFVPLKGYHFPDGPYVEYKTNVENLDKEKLKVDLEKNCNELIKENHKTKISFMQKSEMSKYCKFVPDYLPENKPARVVLYGNFGIPCGGTHVSELSEIGTVIIRKIKNDGENIKIAYSVV